MNLFTTDDEFLAIHPGSANLSLKVLEPFIDQATKDFLIPVLSKDQYADLLTAYQNSVLEVDPVALDQPDINLLYYSRKGLAPIAMALAATHLDVNIDANGIRRSETEGQKTAYQYQRNDWQWDQIKLGLHNLDELHDFLVENINDYAFFEGSEEYAAQQSLFIRSTKDFSAQININNSYWVYRQLRSLMEDVELFKIKPLLGATLYSTIKTQSADGGTFNGNNKQIYLMVKKAVANLTISKATSRLPLHLDHHGITILNTENSKTIEARHTADRERLENYRVSTLRDGELYLDEIKKLLPETEEESTETTNTTNEDEAGNFLAF